MIAFRHADPRLPFLRDDKDQPAARWHATGQGPAHYVSDTPDGAWAEFLRHEEIDDPADLATIRRAMWAVEIGDEPAARPTLPVATVTGGPASDGACIVFFGPRPALVGWRAACEGRPAAELLSRVRPLTS